MTPQEQAAQIIENWKKDRASHGYPALREAIASALAEAQRSQPSAWQPIASAPKDGKMVILATKDGAVGEASWNDGAWYWAGNDPGDSWGRLVYEHEAIAWMPLPSAPEREQK